MALQVNRKEKRPLLLKTMVIAVCLLIFTGLFFYARSGRSGYGDHEIGISYATAKVIEVYEDKTQPDPETENVLRGQIDLCLEIQDGRYKGDYVDVTDYVSAFYNVIVSEGDLVSVSINTIEEGRYSVSIYNYKRSGMIWGMIGLFAAVLALVGGRQGLKALLGLGITMFCMFFLLVPLLVQKGWPVIPTTIFMVAFTSFMTFVIIGGVQTKTMAAAAGTLGGVLIAGLFAWTACRLIHISGMNMDEAETLLLTAADNGLKVKGLLIAGILIAAEGAIMDIAMSIASAVDEVHRANPMLSVRELFTAGMNIGRDAMGTMANTLVLAFAGTSLNMMIFIYAYDVSYIQLMNTDFVAIEAVRSIAGSIGIVLTVPFVALVSAFFLKRKQEPGMVSTAAESSLK